MVLEVASQFSMGQIVQSLTCSIMEKLGRNHIQGWMIDLNMLLSCFREKMSGCQSVEASSVFRRVVMTRRQENRAIRNISDKVAVVRL